MKRALDNSRRASSDGGRGVFDEPRSEPERREDQNVDGGAHHDRRIGALV